MHKKAIIRSGKIIYGDDIQAIHETPNETQAKANREDMKVRHRKDMLQKNQVDYWKVHKDQAEMLNPELRRLLS